MNLSLQHQLVTSFPEADELNVYANKKVKGCIEVSTGKNKFDVLVDDVAKQAVKERGEHTAALRQLRQDQQSVLDRKQTAKENSTKEILMDDTIKLHDGNQCSTDGNKLCPFEHVPSKPMSTENLTSDSLVQNEVRLSQAVHEDNDQVLSPLKRGHSLVPSKWVQTQKPQRLSLKSRWESPLEDVLVSDSIIDLQGLDEWINVSLPRDEG